MKITVLGGDGYGGWATALSLSKTGHAVPIVDSGGRSIDDSEGLTTNSKPVDRRLSL